MIINDVDVSGCEFYDNGECSAQQQFAEGELLWIEKCNDTPDCYYKQLQRTKQELQKFQDMAKKGLEEFKDVCGCWGCGLQLQLNQDIKDFKQLKAENERLKEENKKLNKMTGIFSSRLCEKYRTTLQEIKAIAEAPKLFIDIFVTKTATEVEYDYAAICNELELRLHKVLELITKAEEE